MLKALRSIALLAVLLVPGLAWAQGAPGTVNIKNYVTQGSTTASQTGSLTMGAVTTAAPSYTNAQSSPISLDTAGNLRVNCISGCAAAGDASTGSTAIAGAGQTINLALAGENGAAFQLQSAGTLIATVTPKCSFDGGTIYNVNGYLQDGVTGVVSLTATIASAQATTDYMAHCPMGASHIQLNATAYTSGTANFLARATVNRGVHANIPWGVVNTSAPSYTTGTINAFSLDTSGQLRVAAAQVGSPWGMVVNGAATAFSFKSSLSGAEAALASNSAKRVYLRADLTNSDAIYLGTAGVASTTGYMLNAGDTITVDVTNSNIIHAIVGSGTQVLYALGIN